MGIRYQDSQKEPVMTSWLICGHLDQAGVGTETVAHFNQAVVTLGGESRIGSP
jgi:N-acetylneuraminic acid mutarotase